MWWLKRSRSIFCNIDKKTYGRLIPLAEIDYSNNLKRKFHHVKEGYKTKTPFKFFKAKLSRFQRYERIGLLKVILRSPFKSWRKCDKKLVDYIKGENFK